MVAFSTKVDSNLNATSWRLWMNGPSQFQPVLLWRERTMQLAKGFAITTAPVNNPLNAQHRGGKVGTYKASFVVQRTGNQYGRGFKISNTADHAVFVENGRSATRRQQYFSWSKEGGIPRWYTKTRGRPGDRIIERAVETALTATTN